MGGGQRFVWNWALARRQTHYRETGKGLTVSQLCAELTVLKRQPEFELPDVTPPAPRPEHTVGLGLGLKDLAVLSDGTQVPAPKHYRRAERTLKRLQRHLSRCQKGSKGREQARVAAQRGYAG